MKKSLKFLLASFIFFGCLACGGKSDSASSSSSKANPTLKSAESKDDSKDSAATASSGNRKGKLVYKQYCVICHGSDGTLGVSDATDLSTSTATLEDRIEQITNGKGLMTPYKDILSEDQIKSVAEYVEELRK